MFQLASTASAPTASSAGVLFWTLMDRGGPVMWPLLALSMIGMTLVIERVVFWIGLHGPGRAGRLRQLGAALREGDRPKVERLIRHDRSVYGRVAARLLDDGASDAIAIDAVERERPRLDRFMNALSTIITAAPMLGILGTVTGIIKSFQLIGEQTTLTDPRAVSGGIAEALITTAAGLVIALIVLFPYMAFRH
ncbi:MAG: MotA/TolQ/ExbB proton channel family protein [Phycisphaerales bacterium]